MSGFGQYAVEVLAAYGVTLLLLVGLIGLSLWRGRAVKRALAEAEARVGGHD